MKIFRIDGFLVAVILAFLGAANAQETNGAAAAPAAPADTAAADSAAAVVAPATPAEDAALVSAEDEAAMQDTGDATEKVIVVGYGTQKKRDVTGSVAIVDAKELKQSGQSSVERALQGRAAGVNITQNSGQPGKALTVRIRGIGSTNNSDPLYVVDGVPTGSIDYLNPLDIETITVLKDASSTSIYGSRAANGVVLITTKQGKTGKSEVRANTSLSTSGPWKKPDLVSAAEFSALRSEAYANAGTTPDSTEAAALARGTALGAGGTDWFSHVTRDDAIKKTLDFSMDHGTKDLKFFFSGGVSDEEGIVRRTGSKRSTVRGNVQSRVKDWLTIGENFGFTNTRTSLTDESEEWNSTLITAVTIDPVTPARDADGKLVPRSFNSGIKNPIGVMERANDHIDANRFIGAAYAEIRPWDNLTLKTSYGIDVRHGDSTLFQPSYRVESGDENTTNRVTRKNNRDENWVWENTLSYGLTIGEDHFLKALVGATAEENNHEDFFGSNSNTPSNDPSQRYLGATTGTPVVEGSASSSALVSTLARVNYDIAYKYFLNGSVRMDGSSKFGEDSRWGTFPSVGAGWDIAKEGFMENVGWLDQLKLRLGWGIIGNQNIPNYLYTTTTKVRQDYVLGDEITSGVAFASAGNPNVHWEEQESWNLGFDFQLFSKAFDFSSDFYMKNTKDMLLPENVPSQSGIQEPTIVNTGEVSNVGMDLTVSYQEQFGALSAKVTGVYSMYRNEVTKMENPRQDVDFRNQGRVNRTEEGHPMAMFYGYKTNGLYQAGDTAEAHANGAEPGDIRYVKDPSDTSGATDLVTFIGNPHPDFTYGFSLDLGYKTGAGALDFNVFFQGSQGNDIYNGMRYYTENNTGFFNMDKRMLGRYTAAKPHNDATLPRMNFNDAHNIRISDRYVEDGSYLRLKSMSVGYTFPGNLGFLSSVRLYAGASNLLTFTGYKGLDPEVGTGRYSTTDPDDISDGAPAGVLDIGIDRANYPQSRTFYTGLDISI